MATIKRYPLKASAMDELASDLEKFYYGLTSEPQVIVEAATKRAETYFNGHLSRASEGRQAAITTSTSFSVRKGSATGRLRAVGKTEDTGFNILMAVEFGAGIAYNWGEPNPAFGGGNGDSGIQMGVGTWPGQTHAYDFEGWIYPTKEKDKKGRPIFRHTYGTPATMPMHYTILDIKAELPNIVREAVYKWLT